jgi:hypothetical protein
LAAAIDSGKGGTGAATACHASAAVGCCNRPRSDDPSARRTDADEADEGVAAEPVAAEKDERDLSEDGAPAAGTNEGRRPPRPAAAAAAAAPPPGSSLPARRPAPPSSSSPSTSPSSTRNSCDEDDDEEGWRFRAFRTLYTAQNAPLPISRRTSYESSKRAQGVGGGKAEEETEDDADEEAAASRPFVPCFRWTGQFRRRHRARE